MKYRICMAGQLYRLFLGEYHAANWEHRLLELAGDIPHPSTRPLFSYWANDATLEKAYDTCARITRQHSRLFHLASAFLSEEKRSATKAFYAFCWMVDEIVDESTLAPDARLARRDYWKKAVLNLHASESDLEARAWIDTLTRDHIPRHYAIQLIDGVSRDLIQTRYDTFEDLATYCYGVASTVGLMSMYIIGFKSNDALPYAIKLGVALQMTNILRDVGEDFRKGFVYLPQSELIEFGLTEKNISEATINDVWREFMCYQIARTRQLYSDAQPGWNFSNVKGGWPFWPLLIFTREYWRTSRKTIVMFIIGERVCPPGVSFGDFHRSGGK